MLVPWDRDRYFTAVSLGYQAYVRDLSEKMLKACLFDFRNLRGEPKLRISAADVVEYSPLQAIFEALSSASTDQSRRLSWAMHWLRRARESPDPRDRLLDLWIAMEFLTAGAKTEEICNSSQLNALENALVTAATKLGVKDVGRLADRFRRSANNPSLYDKFEALVSNQVPIGDGEKNAVWGSLRRNRNDLEHGKAFDVEPKDLDIMEQMLSKMIWVLSNHADATRVVI